jgi:chromosomal replication initiator protein
LVRAKDGQEVTNIDMEVVASLRARLAQEVGPERFELWFGDHVRFGWTHGTLRVEADNPFVRDWLRGAFQRMLQSLCGEVSGQPCQVEFEVIQKAAAAVPPSSNGRLPTRSPHPQPRQNPPPGAAAGDGSPVLRRPLCRISDFVVGPTNCLAQATAQMVLEAPGRYSPVLMYGPTGVGKTHLLEGMVHGLRDRRLRTMYLSAEQFTTLFVEALRGSGLPSFRRKCRGVDLLCVDDIQFFCGKKATLVELLHTTESLARDGRQIVFSADRPPSELEGLGKELTARLTGGILCGLQPPDYATRLEIARRLGASMELRVPEDVLELLATRLTDHAWELSGALFRLKAASRALGRPISLALAREAWSDLARSAERIVRLPDVSRAVCDVFELDERSLRSADKSQSVSHPRMFAMWLARKYTRAPLSEIGEYFGQRTHSTVISAQKKVDAWVSRGGSIGAGRQGLKIEDALRRIEQQLRCG